MTSRDYFKGKRIAVIGLGPNGEMVEDVKFLIKAGALVSIYDLKSEARLKGYLIFLRSIGLANFVCGSIPSDDLLDMDIIILSHEYPRDSSFLKNVNSENEEILSISKSEINKNSESKDTKGTNIEDSNIYGTKIDGTEIVPKERKIISIEYPETLFFKQAPPVTVVGVMGACGKSTVVSMLSPMLENVCSEIDGQGFFVMDPESGDGMISKLKKVKSGDIVLFRITESMMKELFLIRISPQVVVCTTIPPRGSYTKAPFEILSYQTYNNFIIANDEIIDATHDLKVQPKAKMLRTKASIIPVDWQFNGKGIHDRDNAALAIQTARLFKVPDEVIQSILSRWKPLKGRLELVKKVRNVEFYNDTASTSPFATETALKALGEGRNTVLIFGGAKGMGDFDKLYDVMAKSAHSVVLLPGSGTMHERSMLNKIKEIDVHSASSIEESVLIAMEFAKKGDKILFSPGFEAVGIDGSRKERGERFVRAVRFI